MSSQPILFLCAFASQFPELIPVAKLIKSLGIGRPVFVFDSIGNNDACVVTCMENGIECVDENLNSLSTNGYRFTALMVDKPSNKVSHSLASFFARSTQRLASLFGLAAPYSRFAGSIAAAKNSINRAKRILDAYTPSLVIIPYEGIGYFYDPVVPLAKRRGINTIVIPFHFVEKVSHASLFLSTEPTFRANYYLENKIFAILFPHWVYKFNEVRLLRLTGSDLFAWWWYGILRPKPWVDNSGFISLVAAESQHMADFLLKEGVAPDKIGIIGTLHHDKMLELRNRKLEMRKVLCQELGIPERDRLIILSLPNEVDLKACPNCKFNNNEEIIDTLAEPLLSTQDCSLIINLHPRLDYTKVKHLESDTVRISKRPIIELVPCADLYVTATSGTIRFAISSGVPVIEYDVWGFGDRYYNSGKGVITVTNKQEYFDSVTQVLVDRHYYTELAHKQKATSAYWGILDGLAAKRLTALITKLMV